MSGDRKKYDRIRYLMGKGERKKKLSLCETAELLGVKPETVANSYVTMLDIRGNFVLVNEKFTVMLKRKVKTITQLLIKQR